MMQKIQRFGGAMYTPAILFAFSGIVVGLGTLFTTEAIFGEMATAGHLWFDFKTLVRWPRSGQL